MIGFMIVGSILNSRLKNKFRQYSQIQISSNLSGKDIAEKMLADHNINDVTITSVEGKLTDHYNPINKTVNLSSEVYNGKNISSAAVAAHECGHAVQHATAYKWLEIRSQMVPIVNYSNKIMSLIFLLGIFGITFLKIFSFSKLILLFVILQTIITLFTLITLPVEFDASKRALLWLKSSKTTNEKELINTNNALNWAASTYIISAMAAATYLLYYISLLKD
tara:strand:- start:186 stop:851 length:666 start_codon:yes stop_codon:yes gene_type:complete